LKRFRVLHVGGGVFTANVMTMVFFVNLKTDNVIVAEISRGEMVEFQQNMEKSWWLCLRNMGVRGRAPKFGRAKIWCVGVKPRKNDIG
jgi:hypothetical protein